jgi:hypothetical protein
MGGKAAVRNPTAGGPKLSAIHTQWHEPKRRAAYNVSAPPLKQAENWQINPVVR